MRRHDREITNEEELLALLDRLEVIRVGFNGDTYPYVVPLSFGWEKTGRLYLYVHGAQEGLRHDLRQRDFRVCVEGDRFGGYAMVGEDATCGYESLIAFGRAEVVHGEDALHGLRCILQHGGFEGVDPSLQVTEHTSVWRITVSQMTGKRHDL